MNQPEQHPDDIAVDQFAQAMKQKLAQKRAEGKWGWDNPSVCSVEYLQTLLLSHIAKGDPVDVANFSMMLYHRKETTVLTSPPSRKQRPFSPAVKERISARYKKQQEERFAPYINQVREGVLRGKTLRQIASETPFKHNTLHKYILGNEELSRLYHGGEPEKSDKQ